MNLRTAISVSLIIFAFGLMFFIFIKPVLQPRQQTVLVQKENILSTPTTEAEPSFFYVRIKQEVKDWTQILAGLSPLLTIILAYLMKKGKS